MPYIYDYARKSPDPGRRKDLEAEDLKANSVEQQTQLFKEEAPRYIVKHPDRALEYVRTYHDDDISAQRDNGIPWDRRPGLQDLFRQASRGDVIMVEALDRLERGGPARALAVEQYIRKLGITLVPLDPYERLVMGMDPSTREFMVALQGLVAAKYAEAVSWKTKRNHRQMLEAGCRITELPPYGYRWIQVGGQTRRQLPRMVMEPIPEMCQLIVYGIWLPIKTHPEQRKTLARSISERLDAEGVSPRPYTPRAHHKWVQKGNGKVRPGRKRYRYVHRMVEAVDKALAEGLDNYGGVPIPKLKGEP